MTSRKNIKIGLSSYKYYKCPYCKIPFYAKATISIGVKKLLFCPYCGYNFIKMSKNGDSY